MSRRILTLLLLALLTLPANVPLAQGSGPPSTTYVVEPFSSLQEGCFAPCMCPIFLLLLGGTFELTSTGIDGAFETFAITDINWTATVGGPLLQQITGTGTYRVSEEHQQLVLDLQTDGGTVEHYDSGLVPVVASFPTIDTVASIGNLYCYDKAVDIISKPLDYPRIDLAVDLTQLGWTALPNTDGYDVVKGSLRSLVSTGDFANMTLECLADDHTSSTFQLTETVPPGDAIWYLVRALPDSSYDADSPSQQSDRQRIDLAQGCCSSSPAVCGSNTDCHAAEFCKKTDGDCAGQGVCVPLAEACPTVIDPVCGCDGTTHDNECEAEMAGVSIAQWGPCN